ncbi:MAG: PmoA family protein [Acidobacteriaceae bacterium]|nr:PmoA family protein [Acidobacteriaceae bacterium]
MWWLWGALGISSFGAGQVELKQAGDDHVSIEIDGQPFSTLYTARSEMKPFLAPLRTASGIVVTRQWPMETIPGESRDHPHHRGLFIGYGDVSGINFWENDPASKPSAENPQTKGKLLVQKIQISQPGTIVASIDWNAPGQGTVIEEQRTLTFYAKPAGVRMFDVDTTLTAKQDARFGDTKEGFFAIRVADSMAGKNGGVMRNSNGAEGEKSVWGQRADWVDYSGTVAGQKVGILIFDNPGNYNHPTRWHSRDYGLFAANPFGVKEFDPKSGDAGGYDLKTGEHLRFRYRVIIHTGDMPAEKIAAWYSEYAKNGH